MSNNKLIRLSKSSIGDEEKNAVLKVLNKEYLGMGEEVKIFEEKLSKFFNREAVCVNTGTSALQLALQASNIGFGDEVLVPSLTYIASYQAISATGAKPISCDIEYNTMLMDVDDAERKISKYTKAIMPVHYTGGTGNLKKVYKLASNYDLRVIEDAAHAFGSTHENKLIGGFGDIACFSFDGIKNITSGEGGCITSNDKDVLNKIKDLRLLGVRKDTDKRYLNKRSWEFEVFDQGWRYHMSNIMAAIGIVQLKRFSSFSSKRQKLAKLYDLEFFNHKKIKINDRNYDKVVPHIYVVKILGLENRERLREGLSNIGIETGIHYYPNHFLKRFDSGQRLEITERAFEEILTLPLNTDMSEEDIKFVCKELKNHLE